MCFRRQEIYRIRSQTALEVNYVEFSFRTDSTKLPSRNIKEIEMPFSRKIIKMK